MKDIFYPIQSYIECEYDATASLMFNTEDPNPYLNIRFHESEFQIIISYASILSAYQEGGLLHTLQCIDETITERCMTYFFKNNEPTVGEEFDDEYWDDLDDEDDDEDEGWFINTN